MKWTPAASLALMPVAALIGPAVAGPRINLTVEQAQQRLFAGEALTQHKIKLSPEQESRMQAASSVREPFNSDRIWRSAKGGWFIVDEVVGKHEMITYALAINSNGTIKGVEIIKYQESYGYEVAEQSWRAHFHGKSASSALKLNQDIPNVSGATLSCKHLTDGIKRLMVMHSLALKGSP